MGRFIRTRLVLNGRLLVLAALALGLAALSFAAWKTQAETNSPEAAASEMNGGVANSDLVVPAPTPEAAEPEIKAKYRGAVPATKFDISPPLRDIKPVRTRYRHPENEERDNIPKSPAIPKLLEVSDPVTQSFVGPGEIPTPGVSFDGPPNSASVSPPDPNGEVGRNHVIVMVNSSFQIFNKSGTSLLGPVNINTLFAGFGGGCQSNNDGDPVVLYDQIADRWLLSQFTATAAPFLNCVAVSKTSDPTGAYYRWAFPVGGGTNFGDYPKYGMNADAYYISTREFLGAAGAFQGVGAYAINRAQMVAGNPNPTVISFLAPPTPAYVVGDGLLPADLDGSFQPAPGTPEYYVGSEDNNGPYGAPADALTLWKFTANFTTPASSSFVLANTIPVQAFNSILGLCAGGRACIPQPGTANKLDHLGYRQRPLFRLAYRLLGGVESLVTNQSVSAGTGPSGEVSGIRWWEIRSPNAGPVIFQEGTYAPGLTDSIHRWMGSIAVDASGDMGLGFSSSSATVFPSVSYTGRLVGDTLGQMPQGEAQIIAGTGSQTGSSRWGDYTDLTVDPTDDCTFWYVNEYVPATSSVGWRARVGDFKFASCVTPTGTASGNITNCATTAPINGATVTLNPGSYMTTTNATGGYLAVAPPGSYTATISAPGYSSAGGTVNIIAGQNTAGDFCLSPTAILSSNTPAVPTGNGIVEPNECNQINLPVTNNGAGAATGVTAVLSTSTPNVQITQPNSGYPDIPPGGTQTNSVPFQISTNGSVACFSSLNLTLTVSFTGGASPQVFNYTLPVGQAANPNYTFTTTTGNVIPGLPANGVLVAASQDDDAAVPVVIPAGFNFSVYGTAITGGTTVIVSTNGNLQFQSSNGHNGYANAAIPISTTTGASVVGSFPAAAPTLFQYWDDLDLRPTVIGAGIYTQMVGSAPNRQWVVEWRGKHFSDGGTLITVNNAIVFNEGSDELNYYYMLGTGSSATIGVQAASSGTQFTQFSLNTASVSPGTRIRGVRAAGACSAGTGGCALAAGVEVSGRVIDADGGGIPKAKVSITGPDGVAQTVLTDRNGSFIFRDVEPGHSYVIAVGARRFSFTPRVIEVTDNVSGLVFTPNN